MSDTEQRMKSMSIEAMAEIRYLVEQLDGDPEALRRVRDATVREIRLLEGIRRVAQDLKRGREAHVGPDPIESLTRRETEVLNLLDTRQAERLAVDRAQPALPPRPLVRRGR